MPSALWDSLPSLFSWLFGPLLWEEKELPAEPSLFGEVRKPVDNYHLCFYRRGKKNDIVEIRPRLAKYYVEKSSLVDFGFHFTKTLDILWSIFLLGSGKLYVRGCTSINPPFSLTNNKATGAWTEERCLDVGRKAPIIIDFKVAQLEPALPYSLRPFGRLPPAQLPPICIDEVDRLLDLRTVKRYKGQLTEDAARSVYQPLPDSTTIFIVSGPCPNSEKDRIQSQSPALPSTPPPVIQ